MHAYTIGKWRPQRPWPCALALRPPPRRLKFKARGPPEEAHASFSLSLFLFQVGSSLLSLACGLRAPLLSSRRLQLFRAFMDGELDSRPTFQVTLLPIGPLQCNHSNFESSLRPLTQMTPPPLWFFSLYMPSTPHFFQRSLAFSSLS